MLIAKLRFFKYTELMKIRILPVIVIIGNILLFGACATSSKTRDFSPHAPLALVTVVANQDINWMGEQTFKSESHFVTDFVRGRLGLNDKEDLTVRISSSDELIDEADAILRKAIEEAGVFKLADKEVFIRTPGYYSAGSSDPKKDSGQIAASGYRFINFNDKQSAQNLSAEAGVKSLLYVTFDFTKEMVSGFSKTGKCRSRVMMTAYIVDSSGKRLYKDEILAHSNDRIAVTTGLYSEDELMDLFREAIGVACYRFIWKFAGTQSGAQTRPR